MKVRRVGKERLNIKCCESDGVGGRSRAACGGCRMRVWKVWGCGSLMGSRGGIYTVSYTHLTLPTIYSV